MCPQQLHQQENISLKKRNNVSFRYNDRIVDIRLELIESY